jgi:hypothetical protein
MLKTNTKELAKAFLMGLRLTYKKQMLESKREVLYELLDDMAEALTTFATEEKNTHIGRYANLLGDLSDEVDIPIPGMKVRKK